MDNLLKNNSDLMSEYNYEKNKDIDLDKLTVGSGKKVWWICGKGHEYECTVNHRFFEGNNCPYCSNQKILEGYNDLITTNPEVLKYWDYEKNDELGIYPNKVSKGTHKKVWWLCDKKHSYEQEIRSKVNGVGCPVCSNRIILKGYNDLATTNPELLKEWDYEKNNFTPNSISKGKEILVWWKCPNCGNSYSCYAYSKKENVGCPYCSNLKKQIGFNDIFTLEPLWKEAWDYEKNIINPEEISRRSKKKIWWICSECKKSFAKSPTHIEHIVLCNECAIEKGTTKKIQTLISKNGSFLENCPEIAKEWDYEKNGDLKPENFTSNSRNKVWWICPVGHSYNTAISYRTKGVGCPQCAKELRISFPEKAFVYYLSMIDDSIIESYEPEFLRGKEIDIYINGKNIGIEYDGRMWHKDKKKDIAKNKLCKENNILLYRIREQGCPELNDTSIDLYYEPDSNYKNLSLLIYDFVKNIYKKDMDIDVNRDRMKIYNLVEYTIKTKSLFNLYPEIAKEWDYEKNGDMKPNQFYSTSSRKVWWICEKGHSYESTISHRTMGKTSCPYCASQKLLDGYNDLATTNPELLKEWNYKKNDELKIYPNKVFKGSNKKVWWKCSKGHEWESSISNRLSRGCPVCTNRKIVKGINDITTTNPEVLKKWNYEKNNELGLSPENFSAGSSQKVWWICEKGHEWNQRINHIVNGVGCPVCAGKKIIKGINDLESLYPEIAKVWDYEKNKNNPSEFSPHSQKKVWWTCINNHSYERVISSQVLQNGKCPICKSSVR